jgi:mono/diheme cytochrome c family protein
VSERRGSIRDAVGAAGAAVVSAVVAFCLAGCSHQKSEPAIEYMPNMAYGPRVAAQAEDPLRPGQPVMRNPVPGTVPVGYTPYRYAQADTLEAARDLVNPLPRTAAVLARGQKVYMNTCVVCHGPQGDGQGYIVPLFPMPPSLHSAKVRGWPDGRIFHVITRGQNLMPSYASQILPEDRWAVIHYVRALERSHLPVNPDSTRAVRSDSTGTGAASKAKAAGKAMR